MKKREERKKPRRLTLSRETIRVLAERELLEPAKGGYNLESAGTCTTTSHTAVVGALAACDLTPVARLG